MPRRACLVFNPAAGQGDSEADLSRIRQLLEPKLKLKVEITDPETNIPEMVQRALDRGFDSIIASGGDGTVSAVASALSKKSVPLGIIARGTANAFANALEIPTKLEEACNAIIHGTTRRVDMARTGDSHMILLAGIGLEAEAVRRADRNAKDRFGALAYIFAGFNQLKALEAFEAVLEIDGDRTIQMEASAITIANAAPMTSILAQGPAGVIPDDGLLDVTVVAPDGILDALAASVALFRSALQGAAATQQSIGHFRARTIKVTTSPAQYATVDGELVGQTPLEFECLSGALTVLTPPQAAHPPTPAPNLIRLPYPDSSQLAWLTT